MKVSTLLSFGKCSSNIAFIGASLEDLQHHREFLVGGPN
jgi:hypothetical protein